MYRCEDCGYTFEHADTVKEFHGLAGPCEITSVCPNCKSTNFSKYSPDIPKLEVAERLLEAICDLHTVRNALETLFGENIENKRLDGALGNLTEFVLEMFPNTSPDTDKLIYSVNSSEQIAAIMKALEG